ncbi:MAG: ion transporter [Verrucomicrobiales bacterium]|nr:ion transporter [Verrucomicrobiales bacterium]
MKNFCQRVTESSWFNRFIVGVILLAGVVVGLETDPEIVERHHTLLSLLDKMVLIIFIIEIAMKMIALAPRPLDFFKDPWNVFDFVIVVVCLIPASGGFGPVLRLFRLMRVLRLLSAIPKLQILVSALLKSLPSMVYVSILLFLLFYIYGVAGVMFFGKNDPVHFGNVGVSLLSLFRVVTLEDWTDVMYIQIYGSDKYEGYNLVDAEMAGYTLEPQAMPILSVVFFVSFVLLGTMIMLNLVIGVIINGMDDARIEAEIENIKAAEKALGGPEKLDVQTQVTVLSKQIRDIAEAVERIGKMVGRKQ